MATLSDVNTCTISPDAAHAARARLVEHLERLSPRETACEATLLAELAPAVPDRDALRALLASIGAVCVGTGWCFGDGPPPGWAWYAWPISEHTGYVLARAGENRIDDRHIAAVEPVRGWHAQYPGGRFIEALSSGAIGLAYGQRESLRVCRLHGLFAEVV